MSLQLRFALLLGAILGAFGVSVFTVQQMETRAAAADLDRERQTRAQLVARWLEAASRALPQVAADLADAAELGALLAKPGSDISPLARALAAAGVPHAWVLDAHGSALLRVAAPGAPPDTPLPLAASEFAALIRETPHPRFFALDGPRVLEVCIRRRSGAGDALPLWIAVARPWDEAHLRTLRDLMESRVSLAAPHALAAVPEDAGALVLSRPLPDWQGNPLRTLRIESSAPERGREAELAGRRSRVFFAFGVFLLLALGVALHRWVLDPLRRIEHGLGRQDPQAVAPLAGEQSELGRVAGLVVSSFAQRSALEREIAERTRVQAALERTETSLRRNLEERARLGRDLHDGVIQSLYAAGMGLAGIRAQLRPEQSDAAERLEQTRATLNETIHDVRNFIIGLEPEALKLQTFTQAISALLDTLQRSQPIRAQLGIDETLAARLTLAQRVHALQIAREAVSNAVRHGAAAQVVITLQSAGDRAHFEVADDGRGFDPSVVQPGSGLANFAQRARELGGALAVESRPGTGARIRLSFPKPD
jgi:signal transduction histidine kinase